MKRRPSLLLTFTLLALLLANAAWAQTTNTRGGTVISNVATATFVDSNDVARSTTSNTVETLVQTVYSFEVSPDDTRAPTPASDFAGYVEDDGLNDATGAASALVEFEYTLTNNTNDTATFFLEVVQDASDDFNLASVGIFVSTDGTTFTPYDPALGITLAEQGDLVTIQVRGTIPSGVLGNEVALIDLVATLPAAALAGQTGPNISYETNNIARTTVGEAPQIGVAKSVAGVTNNGDGSYTVEYLITVANMGNVPLAAVQVVEDLAATFAAAAAFGPVTVTAGGTLTANPDFDGVTDTDLLLAGSSSLAFSTTHTIALTVVVTPGSNLGPYENSVTASGDSPGGATTTDGSVPGTTPEPGRDEPTPVTFDENPAMGLAKAATPAVDAPGFAGQFITTITMTLSNLGDVEVRGVQVTDLLTATFPPATTSYAVVAAPVVTITTPASGGVSTLVGNSDFDGDGDPNLLAAGGTLARGETVTITFDVRFDPQDQTGPFDNTATATGTSPAGEPVEDDSNPGTDPDPDDAAPTPITYTERPLIGLAKNLDPDPIVDASTQGGEVGEFDVTFVFTVRNYGNVDLDGVQIVDNLAARFAGATIVSIEDLSSGTLTVNPDFGSGSDWNLLAPGQTLRPAEFATVSLTVRINPNGITSFNNFATASGTSPGSALATDVSHDGTDPAPGGGDPGDFSDPTLVTIPERPLLGVAKNMQGVVNNGDGSYVVTYLITVRNYGNVPLSSLQVVEDLAATFAGATFSGAAVTATSGGLTANPAFTGTAPNTGLLTGGDTLAVGATGTITLSVTVTPGSAMGPYDNQVTASATSPAGPSVFDLSTDGTDPDQNGDVPADDGDGDPTNTDSATPVSFSEAPLLGLAKSATPATDVPDMAGTFETTITFTLQNYGDVELRDLQITDVLSTTFPAPATFEVMGAPTSATLTVNLGFDGSAGAGSNVLAGTDTLARGATAEVSFVVRFQPNGAPGFENTATATGTSPAGSVVTDDSHDGSDPAPGGGDPGDFSEPTPITFTERPLIGVAKAGSVIDYGNTDPALGDLGPFTLRIDFRIENFGNVALSDVSLSDDLDEAFRPGNYQLTLGPVVQTASTSPGSSIAVNPNFDGSADTELLALGGALAIGDSAVVRIELEVFEAGSYTNQATGSGTGPGGGVNTDDSHDGSEPAPGGGNPNDYQTPTTWNLDQLRLLKSVRTCADAGCTTVLDPSGANVAPGEYLEYTIAATAVGDLGDVVVTDAIPVNTLFVLGSASADATCSTDGGLTYDACPLAASGPYADANGLVTHVRWTVGDLADGATQQVGFVVRVR